MWILHGASSQNGRLISALKLHLKLFEDRKLLKPFLNFPFDWSDWSEPHIMCCPRQIWYKNVQQSLRGRGQTYCTAPHVALLSDGDVCLWSCNALVSATDTKEPTTHHNTIEEHISQVLPTSLWRLFPSSRVQTEHRCWTPRSKYYS